MAPTQIPPPQCPPGYRLLQPQDLAVDLPVLYISRLPPLRHGGGVCGGGDAKWHAQNIVLADPDDTLESANRLVVHTNGDLRDKGGIHLHTPSHQSQSFLISGQETLATLEPDYEQKN